jgi:mediator of RNA polymerase II transcription subunit 13
LSFTGTETEFKELLAIEPKSDTSDKVTFVGKDNTFIRVAQMVADQAVSGPETYQTSPERHLEMDSGVMMASDQRMESVMRRLFSSSGKISKRCTIREYASLRDREVSNVSEPTLSQQNQRMPKAFYPTKPAAVAQDVFKLHAPYTCVRRTGAPMDISASALRFWEELSLAPAHGNKNVKAFCIFPSNVDTSDDVTRFLNMIKGAYQSCNLGLHDLGAGLSDYSNGLVHVPTDDDSVKESLPPLTSACRLLGTRLGHLRLQGGDFVIYMVDSSTANRTVPDLCAAFLDMFEAYNTTLREQHIDRPNDMVLQILPSSLICSTSFIPMPTPADYRKLAFDVYDRCSPNQTMIRKSQHRSLSAPAVYLAKAIPKAIDLKLTPESSAPRLQSDNCIHVAYAWTSGDRWLSAAWTDNHGILSWNACYCFGEEDETPWESFTDIAREIWDTTLDLMQGHSSWRVFLCKDSPADRRELDGKY